MSINEMMTRKQFKHLQERYLESVRVAQENTRNGYEFKNGMSPMPEGRREIFRALLDENFQSNHKFKGEK